MAKRKNLPGPTDTVPALLTPGEHVMNREAVALLGAENLERANKMGLAMRNQVQGFAMGGVVAPEQKFVSILRGNTTNEPIQGWNAREAEFKGFLDKNGLQEQSKIYDSASFNEKQNMMGRYNTNDGFKLQQTGPTAYGSTPEQVAELKAKNPAMQVYSMDSPQYSAYKANTDQAKANYNAINTASAPNSSAAPQSQGLTDVQRRMDDMKTASAQGVANNAANIATAQRSGTAQPDSSLDTLKAIRASNGSLARLDAAMNNKPYDDPQTRVNPGFEKLKGLLSDDQRSYFDGLSHNAKGNYYGLWNKGNGVLEDPFNKPSTSYSAGANPGIGNGFGAYTDDAVAQRKGLLGFSEGGEVPYYYQPGGRNVYAGRDLQPSLITTPQQPAAQIKNAGQTVMRDGSSYYGKPMAKPLSRPVDKASLPAPPVLIQSQATNAIRGDVAPVQQAPTQGQVQQRESARAWQRTREEAPAPAPGVDLAPVEYGPKFRHSDAVDVGVQGLSEGGQVVKNLDYIQPRPIQGWTPEQMIGEQGVEDVRQAVKTGKQFARGLGGYVVQQAGNVADAVKGTAQAAKDRVSNRFNDTRYGALGGTANVGLGVVEDFGRVIDAGIIKPLAKVGSDIGQIAYDKINPQQQFVQAPPQQTMSQPLEMNPETKAWGDRSLANIREGERNRMAAREKMQNMITDRQARAQGDLDARAAQQAQHQAWLDKSADSHFGAQSGNVRYTQNPGGSIIRNEGGESRKLAGLGGQNGNAEAARERMIDDVTRWNLRGNPQALARYASSRLGGQNARYATDKNFENAGLDRTARAAENERNFGLQERGQQFNEDKYNQERGDGQSTRELANYVAGLELAARQGDEKAINALKTWMALNTKPKTYEQAKEKLTDANGNVIERTVGSFDNQTGAITKAPGAYTPQDYADFYGKLLSKFGGDQERAMQEYASFFAKNQG